MNLFNVINRWNAEHVQSVCISLTDLTNFEIQAYEDNRLYTTSYKC